jgi:hypothetical protein
MNSHQRRKIWQFPRMALKRFMTGLLKVLLLSHRPARLARSGFVLPTTFLLVLMVLLTATALTYRSFTRSDQAITQREQKIIVNAATPAIDRAKAKIEFLFQDDPRFPSGLPSSDVLADLMSPVLDAGNNFVGYLGNQKILPGGEVDANGNSDPYTLPDEERVDINGDGDLDNAWSYNIDINGDGVAEENEVVVYSILVDDAVFATESAAPEEDEQGRARSYVTGDVELADPPDQTKANSLVTRTGPLATTEATPACQGALAESGWQVVDQGNNSSLQKNFQVNAFVTNRNDANQTFETMEFQQSRIASRANKWGAWFRYDLEIFPGPTFNWNGAMHTDSNLFIRNGLNAFMVSSHNSCLYSAEASEITLGEVDIDGDDDATPGKVVFGDDSVTRLGTEFQGQAVKGAITQDNYTSGSAPGVHVFNGDRTIPITNRNLTDTNDSVNGGRPSDIAVNPLVLFTEDRTVHIDASSWNRETGAGKWYDDAADNFRTRERIYNDKTAKPFVDDFFRADNRWGPKPRYEADNDDLDVTKQAATIGDDIPGSNIELTAPLDGLDGYWERQAVQRGMRVIVGERLELGNPNGWNYDPTGGNILPAPGGLSRDPLYPPYSSGLSTTEVGGSHEYRQRRSLRDNLAAVQSMAVYHYEGGGMATDGDFPAVCMALTAHPGTQDTILKSRTFNNWLGATTVKTDFLTGQGTNGWEFQFPADSTKPSPVPGDPPITVQGFNTEADFEVEVAADKPLGIALRNLAYFAGDPYGGAPSFKPIQEPDIGNVTPGSEIHPYPYMAMWGDFSPLRRVFDDYLDNSVTYAQLSPADKATLHTAACTLSMLAYNLKSIEQQYNGIPTGVNAAELSDLATKLTARVGNGANQIPLANVATTPSEDWIAAVDASDDYVGTIEDTALERYQAIAAFRQVERDRTLGFNNLGPYSYTVPAGATTYTSGTPYGNLTCDPTTTFTSVTDVDDKTSLLLAFCSAAEGPKYPSLFYLFPKRNHDQTDSTPPAGFQVQPATEEFISLGSTYMTSVNTGFNYAVVGDDGPAVTADIEDADDTGIAAIAALPASTDPTTWVLPAGSAAAGTLSFPIIDDPANPIASGGYQPFAIAAGANLFDVPFLDKALFDGREQLNTRVLDIDIEALTTNSAVSSGDLWLTDNEDNGAEGVVFAFREDAVREDEIVRPKNSSLSVSCSELDGSVSNPRKFYIETTEACRMRVLPGTVLQDPPLTADLISLKPVDFIPDPDRRNHGFRLRTASGNPADFSANFTRESGMTFVTDNSVYVVGNFNLHSTGNTVGTIVEEFDETINDKDFDPVGQYITDFYTNRTTLNTDTFANKALDRWRPVEILTDAVTILSGNFRDGAVSDTFTKARPNSAGGADSSYMNQNRPRNVVTPWRENGTASNSQTEASPVWIDRNGTFYIGASSPTPFYSSLTTDNQWVKFADDGDRTNNQQRAGESYVNATFISGLIPKRPFQNNGGFHNFPRFLEDWNNLDLHIAGSFIQLNFSTIATGQFDQDSWEEGQNPNSTDTNIQFYRPPNRRWGFDPGLLYVPPAPAAERFVSIGSPRSEYYRELPANDPYIENLRCAEDAAGNRVLAESCPRP